MVVSDFCHRAGDGSSHRVWVLARSTVCYASSIPCVGSRHWGLRVCYRVDESGQGTAISKAQRSAKMRLGDMNSWLYELRDRSVVVKTAILVIAVFVVFMAA